MGEFWLVGDDLLTPVATLKRPISSAYSSVPYNDILENPQDEKN